MKVLILAAGQGNRLKDHTRNIPKALIRVGGTELVAHQLRFARGLAPSAIGVVAGCHFPLLKAFLSGKNGSGVEIFENRDYARGSILSLRAAEEFLDDDLLLMNVDHLYPGKMRSILLDRKENGFITAFCDFDRPLVEDDMKVQKNAGGFLGAIHKQLPRHNGGYIGMSFVPKARQKAYKEAILKGIGVLGEKASAEHVLGLLVGEGEKVAVADTSGIRWLEIDSPEDLQRAEAALQEEPNFLR